MQYPQNLMQSSVCVKNRLISSRWANGCLGPRPNDLAFGSCTVAADPTRRILGDVELASLIQIRDGFAEVRAALQLR